MLKEKTAKEEYLKISFRKEKNIKISPDQQKLRKQNTIRPSLRKAWQPTPVFLPGEPHGGYKIYSFKLALSLSSFTIIKRLFSSSLLSAIYGGTICMSDIIVLPAILIPACDSCSPAFCMMYSEADKVVST